MTHVLQKPFILTLTAKYAQQSAKCADVNGALSQIYTTGFCVKRCVETKCH